MPPSEHSSDKQQQIDLQKLEGAETSRETKEGKESTETTIRAREEPKEGLEATRETGGESQSAETTPQAGEESEGAETVTEAREESEGAEAIREAGNESESVERDREARDESQSTSLELTPIVKFYQGESDFDGRTLSEILNWSDGRLEYNHDYIQILFPLPERSPFNPWAPKLDEETIEMFKSSHRLQTNMRKAFDRMLSFYGFDHDTTSPSDDTNGDSVNERLSKISPNPRKFPKAARNWINSHNDLRITRIIRCLRCCGMETEAKSFYAALKALYDSRIGYPRRINDHSFMYWTRAARRDIRIPPDMSDAEAASALAAVT